MIVPKFWSEARLQERIDGHQVTLRRFGWSDVSEEDAAQQAGRRVAEAMERRRQGEKVIPREHKVPYNGAEGVPIREEVVAEFPPHVITRNSYGALCLNTPNVLFADIDFAEPISPRLGCSIAIAAILSGIAVGIWRDSAFVGFFAIPAVGIVLPLIIKSLRWLRTSLAGGPEKQAIERVRKYIAARPNWQARVYRTPSGIRVLVTHQTFSSDDPETNDFFKSIQADPQYVRMSLRQKCFRARLTAKPWRIGISRHMRPRPGVWPIRPERRAERDAWLKDYDEKATPYAACTYLETLGSDPATIDPIILTAQTVHDEYSKATANLPIA